MTKNNLEFGPPIPIKEAMEKDPALAEVMEKIRTGEIPITDGTTGIVWTQEDKDRLDKALKEHFGK